MAKENQQKNSFIFPTSIPALQKKVETELQNKPDLSFNVYQKNGQKIAVFFIPYLIDSRDFEQFILHALLDMEEKWTTNEVILNRIPIKLEKPMDKLSEIIQGLVDGRVFIYIEHETEVINYDLGNAEKRSLEKAETESIVLGPQLTFTESLTTNMNVISWRLNTPDLAMEKVNVGERVSKEVRIIYLSSVANETDVNTMRQRLTELQVDVIEDAHMLKQYINDSSTTVFPLFANTELIDRAMYAIKQGKIAVLVEDSPLALIAPSTFFSFYESTEDMYLHWNSGTLLRMLRLISAFLTVLLTPMYVVATTFHYEMIPTQLLISIGQSRSAVPFPPILEVLLLELVIELLREAGARLPTKVGQTIGIVGGVVVGTAAVQAGITSNILVILITLSALASFTTPSYIMGTSIRLIRFPVIILSGFYGIIGIMFGLSFLMIHLLKLSSLGRSYLSPLYPLQLSDFNLAFFRLPEQRQGNRFKSYQMKDKRIFKKKKAMERKDIDE